MGGLVSEGKEEAVKDDITKDEKNEKSEEILR